MKANVEWAGELKSASECNRITPWYILDWLSVQSVGQIESWEVSLGREGMV